MGTETGRSTTDSEDATGHEHVGHDEAVQRLRGLSMNHADLRNKMLADHLQHLKDGDGNGVDNGMQLKRTGSAPTLAHETEEEDLPKISIGVCAMDKKANSKQMKAIIQRLLQYGEFEVVIFGDDTILNKPVDKWPVVQCLLSWHSGKFPLHKAQEYVLLRKPYLINDVFAQDILLDRRRVYRKLMESGIPVPNHIIVDREGLPEGQADPDGFEEGEDYVELDGVRIEKPFVEKPASGEDHNIYIYYPHSMGGGVKRLFRKVDNKSADYDPKHPGTVRREGSYIYEEFLTTGGTDVKVYTVGPRYAHAEARKSPVVDGKVQRTADGKEVRFPVLLSPQEKEIARSVCLAFGQRVCGFDLLRSERGRSYVCDVNGWSFVKNSQKYYDDAAGIIRMTILSAVAPHRLLAPETFPFSASGNVGEPCIAPENLDDNSMRGMNIVESYDDVRNSAAIGADDEGRRPGEELRCVLAVIRHGDRTPKQKMKMLVTQKPFLDLFHKYIDSKGKQAKLKSPNELQELLDVTRGLLEEMENSNRNAVEHNPEADELREKFRIVKTVLEQGGQFAGINRKVQLKPLKWSDEATEGSEEPRKCVEALLILKHGGVLTHAGRQQAEALGSLFRNVMYPQNGPTGGGLLRLHSTYRHDLKIYSSDEGRVQTSAAAFAKGLLDLEGSALTPILVSLVNKDAGMLDAFGKGASVDINASKQELYAQMTYNLETKQSEYAFPEYSLPARMTPPASPIPGGLGAVQDVKDNSSDTSQAPSISSTTSLPPSKNVNVGIPGTFTEENGPVPQGASNIEGRPHIFPMPSDPLASLRRLNELIKSLVDQLREKCLEEARNEERPESYSALTMDPEEWHQEQGKPCSGEKLLLMFDRWRKLTKAFFSEKKGYFDISKIPDIYDAAKYDSIHNAHLGLNCLEELYESAKELAAAVIPNEYGLQPLGKLRIGSTICANLLGKLLADLASMRDESMATAGLQHSDEASRSEFAADLAANLAKGQEEDKEDEVPLGSEDVGMDDGDDATMHRLCPTYAQDVNSPLRHVRTRIYFTSESHCHSLVNVLRFCQLGMGGADSILGPEGQDLLQKTTELDYMTHVVFRMFENKSLPLRDPGRFRVEILFSPGAAHNPYEVVPLRKDHVIPIVPRMSVHREEGGVTLQQLEQATKPYAKPFKRKTDPYIQLKGAPVTAQATELDFWI